MLPKDPPLLLETRSRWRIPNESRPERNKAALDASVQLFKGLFPEARLRSITAVYNCVGMVVASRRAWVTPEDLMHVLREDDFRRLADVTEAELGDVVVYHDEEGEATHVGVFVRKNLIVPGERSAPLTLLSKWGADGEYVHDMAAVPKVYGTAAEFWTDRRGT